jgi:oligoendopeptidase F
MKVSFFLLMASLAFAWPAAQEYELDLTQYFASPADELRSRTAVLASARSFIETDLPNAPAATLEWLKRYENLLQSVRRHDIYLRLVSAENVRDAEAATADRAMASVEDAMANRITDAARALGQSEINRLTQAPGLGAYRFLLNQAFLRGGHRLSAADDQKAKVSENPELVSAASRYNELRKSAVSIGGHQDEYAALLVAIATARNQSAHARGFSSAADAAYFDRSLSLESVEYTLSAVRASHANSDYRRLAAIAPMPGGQVPGISFSDAVPLIVAATRQVSDEYAILYDALLNPSSHRVELCNGAECEDGGFSVGFLGATSGLYLNGFAGTVNDVRAVAHESGHAVHRELMNRNQTHAVYNIGPSFMFESFSIFSELLLLDHLYRSAPNDDQRRYYLNAFVNDATFQVFGSAEETELEAAICDGVYAGTVKSANDLIELTRNIFARYDPASATSTSTTFYWARNRLYFTDPMYDVNYLYAGLLALKYFALMERAPASFGPRYVALLKNGFTDSPSALEQKFLGIDLANEKALVADASSLIEIRTSALERLYAQAGSRR